MLKTLTLDTDALRAGLLGGTNTDPDYFTEFKTGDTDGSSFDYVLLELVQTMNESQPKPNAALTGERTTAYGLPLEGSESIDACLIAGTDGVVEGYMFTYDLWGTRRLSLATRFIEWRHLQPESDGIDGVIELAEQIIALVNQAILNTNEFVAGVSA